MARCLASLAMGLAFASSVTADSWPQWRGPNRDAVSSDKNLRDRWDDAPPLIWKAHGLGNGYAGAAVDRGIVCTVGDRKDTTTVIAVSDKDGREIWATPIDDFKISGNGSVKAHGFTGSKSTPTIDGERVYAVSSNGVLACLNIASGKLVWRKSYGRDFDGLGPEWGYSESPLIDGDKLICTPGGSSAGVVALDKKTGAELWRCALTFGKRVGYVRRGASYASPVISNGAKIKQYVQLMGLGLVGIDANTGKQLWNYTRAGAWTNPCTPIVRDDYIFVPCGEYHGSALLKLVATSSGGVEVKEVYFLDIQKLKARFGGAVLVGDYVYASHMHPGSPQCIEFFTGKLMWGKQRCRGRGPAAVVYADGHLYYQYENGVVALANATPNKYQLKGMFRIPGESNESWAHPAICNGRLYLRHDDVIYCYDLKK